MSKTDQLREQAERALASADYSTALEVFAKLEKQQPQQGIWSKKIADVYRRTQQRPDEMRALARAADRYAAAGEVMQAIVMCKRMLDLDPNDPQVMFRLGQLHPKLREAGHARPRIEAVPIRAEIEDALPINEISVARALGIQSDEAISAISIISDDDVSAAFDTISGPKEIAGTYPLTPFFAALREDSFRRLIDKLRLIPIAAGDFVFHQGDPGESFFVISEGAVQVMLEDPSEQLLNRLDEGEFFGEIALITDHPRTASVRAIRDTLLIEIDRRAVSELIYEDPDVMTVLLWFLRDRLVDTLIRTSEIFDRIPHAERRGLADRFRFLECKRNTTLIEQGQAARGLIIVLAGRARVMRDGREIAVLGPGDICGEMSLLSAQPAVATVRTDGQVFALEISVKEFKQIAAEHPDMLLAVEEIADRRLPLI